MKLTARLNLTIAGIFFLMVVIYLLVEIPLQKNRISLVTQKMVSFLNTITDAHVMPLANEIFEERYQAVHIRMESLAVVDGIKASAVFKKDFTLVFPGHEPGEGVPTLWGRPEIRAMLEQHEIYRIIEDDLYFLRPVKAQGEIFGFLVIRFAFDDVRKMNVRDIRSFAAFIFAALALAFVLFDLLVRKMVILPVRVLNRKMAEFEQNRYAKSMIVTSRDEIGELTVSFNRMAEKISASLERIEQKNQELYEIKSFVENILNNTPDIIFRLDREFRISYVNHAVLKYGYTPTDLIGKDPLVLVFPEEAAKLKILAGQPGEFPRFRNLELRFLNAGKTPADHIGRHESATGLSTLVVDMDALFSSEQKTRDSFIGYQGMGRDISNHVRMQNIMVQTEKMMAVGGLAAGMAHEINNPLGIILQSAQNITRRLGKELPANSKAAEELGLDLSVLEAYLRKRSIDRSLGAIKEAGERAAEIVRSMLEFSRKSGSEKTLCRPEEMMENALEIVSKDYDLKRGYDFKNIRINRHYNEVKPVFCVRSEIVQVLLNILKNAAQAMAEKMPQNRPPEIDLFILQEDTDIRMEIRDNGPGIDEKNRHSIFEPFFTTKTTGEGTGLGLSVSYFIITSRHRGRLWVESRKGDGSRFIIQLPEH